MSDAAAAGSAPTPAARPAMQRFMRPRSIAVIGAAATPGALGAGVVANLDRFRYAGAIHLVNPNRAEIGGRPCLRSADELPMGVDCAVLAVPRGLVLDAVQACARRGVGGVVVYASGFAEAGPEGRALQEQVAAVARAAGMVLEGPNCLGYVNNVDGVALTFGPAEPVAIGTRRAISVAAQSGSMSGVMRAAWVARGLAVAFSISTGNEAATGIEDYLEFLLDDPHTSVVSLFVEQIREPQRFVGLCGRARGCGKAIVLLHVGRSAAGRASALTHTGAISGDYDVMRAVVEREGVLCAETYEELLDLGELLVRFPQGLRGAIAVITESGAFKSVAVDYCDALGIALAQPDGETAAGLERLSPLISAANPLDVTSLAVSDPRMFCRALQPFLVDDRYGGVLLNKTGSSEVAMTRAGAAIIDGLRALAPAKPVIFTTLGDEVTVAPEIVEGFRALDVPFFRSPERALRALGRWQQASAVAWSGGTEADSEASPLVALELPEKGSWTEHAAKVLLAGIGVPTPAGRLVRDRDAAIETARDIGFPVALKAQAGWLLHKTEVGGVRLGLHDAASVAEAWDAIAGTIARNGAGRALDGVRVERMAAPGLEMIVAARRDDHWGPVIVVGMGGIWAEALRDVVVVPAASGPAEIARALRRLKSAALLDGWRGAPSVDVAALCDIAARLAQLVLARAEIAEVELNPVVVYARGEGAVALDVLITTAAARPVSRCT